jgi:Leucine rich repeat
MKPDQDEATDDVTSTCDDSSNDIIGESSNGEAVMAPQTDETQRKTSLPREVMSILGLTPPPLVRSHSLNDLESRDLVSFSQQVGRINFKTTDRNEQLEGSTSPRSDQKQATALALGNDPYAAHLRQTGLRSPIPPPPSESTSVQRPYTTPGAVSIRPQMAPLQDLPMSPVRPMIDAARNQQHHSSEILIEAHLVEEESTQEVKPPSNSSPPDVESPSPPNTPDAANPVNAATMEIVQAKEVYFDESEDFRRYSWFCCRGRRSNRRSRRNLILFLLFVAMLGVIGLLIGLLLNSRKKQETTLEAFIRSELPDYSQEAIAADDDSPQSKAVDFLAEDPQLDSYRAYRRLQRFALAVFYYDLKQSRAWRNSSLWLSVSSECDWYSTRRNETCAPEDLLVALSLRDNQLSGTIPAEISLLTSLKYLELSGNYIRGTIPREIDRIASLSRLILSDNDMTGSLPHALGKLHKLTHIDLSGNGFTGSIPELLFSNLRDGRPTGDMEEGPHGDKEEGRRDSTKKGSLRRNMQERGAEDPLIEVANFTNNRLTGSIPADIGMSRRLQRLEFRGNNLTGTLPSGFSNLTRLEHFGTCISRILAR